MARKTEDAGPELAEGEDVMKRRVSAWLGVTLCLLWPLEANAGLKVRYFKGQPTLISIQPESIVQLVVPPAQKSKRIGVGLVVLNRSAKPSTLGYENIEIRTITGAPIALLPFDLLEKKARARANWALFFAAVGAGLNSYAAQQSAYGSYSSTGYTNTAYGGVRSSYTTSYYSPAAAQIGLARANAESQELFTGISAQLDATLAQLDGSVLRTTTVDPGAAYGGAVVFDLPKGTALTGLVAVIRYADEVHEIPLQGDLRNVEAASGADLDQASGEVTAEPRGAAVDAIKTTMQAKAALDTAPVQTGVCKRPLIRVVTDPYQNVCGR